MRRGVIRVQLDGSPELAPGCLPVPEVIKVEQPQRRVRLAQRVVEFDGLRRRFRGLRRGLRARYQAVPSEGVVRVGQPGISRGIVRVFLNRLLEIADGFPEIVGRALVQVVAPLQVELVAFSVSRVVPDELLLLFAGQPQPKLTRNLPRDLLLDGEHVRDLALVLLAPELRTRLHVHQVHLHVQRVAQLTDAPRQNCSHVQLATHRLRVGLTSLVAEGRRARDDAQPLELRHAVNQRLRNAVGQVLCVRVAAHVGERQDGNRVSPVGEAIGDDGGGGEEEQDEGDGHAALVPPDSGEDVLGARSRARAFDRRGLRG